MFDFLKETFAVREKHFPAFESFPDKKIELVKERWSKNIYRNTFLVNILRKIIDIGHFDCQNANVYAIPGDFRFNPVFSCL